MSPAYSHPALSAASTIRSSTWCPISLSPRRDTVCVTASATDRSWGTPNEAALSASNGTIAGGCAAVWAPPPPRAGTAPTKSRPLFVMVPVLSKHITPTLPASAILSTSRTKIRGSPSTLRALNALRRRAAASCPPMTATERRGLTMEITMKRAVRIELMLKEYSILTAAKSTRAIDTRRARTIFDSDANWSFRGDPNSRERRRDPLVLRAPVCVTTPRAPLETPGGRWEGSAPTACKSAVPE
mmetsp:Transcript_24068/g.55894  ORF Transcript_24068/g.55894 Transcript_24068/m.55894 type:complete len:243 (-) Transcript_24068:456-1184(-)